MTDNIRINRAPVLTLWAAVVAERLGFDRATALTLGRAAAGLSAHAKGVSLGILEPRPELVRERGERLAEGEELRVDLLGRLVPVVRTPDGLRAVSKGKPGNPASIEKYLAGKFGDRIDDARTAMAELAVAYEPGDLNRRGFRLYEKFRPEVPRGRVRLGCQGRARSGEGARGGVLIAGGHSANTSRMVSICSSSTEMICGSSRPASSASPTNWQRASAN